MGSWGDDAMGVGWRSGGRDGLAVLGRPSRSTLREPPASADLRQGERPFPRGWIHDWGREWRGEGVGVRPDVEWWVGALDPSRGLGMGVVGLSCFLFVAKDAL